MLVQSWSGSAAFLIKEIAGSTIRTDYSESKNGFVVTPDFYLSSWIKDFAFILPFAEGGQLEQKGSAGFKGSVLTLPLGCTLDAALGFHDFNFTGITRTSFNTLDYGLSFPTTILFDSNKNVVFTTGYKRHFDSSVNEESPGGLPEDVAAWGRTISSHPYIFSQIPLFECFDPAAESAFIDAHADLSTGRSLYKPEIFANFAKQAGSSLIDLLLPSQGEISYAKQFTREAGLFDFRSILKVSFVNNAINLFGRVGSYPLFNFFISDEYILSFLMNLELKGELVKNDCFIDGYFIFRGLRKDAFSISNQLRIQSDIFSTLTERCSLIYEWGVYPEAGVKLPIVSESVGATGFWSNKEECTVLISDSQLAQSIHPVTVIVTHSTGLSYPDTGYIRGLFSVGIDFERIGATGGITETFTRLAFKAGIEAQFKW
jgi:hypothetical protein